jgi:hypothetical protein
MWGGSGMLGKGQPSIRILRAGNLALILSRLTFHLPLTDSVPLDFQVQPMRLPDFP